MLRKRTRDLGHFGGRPNPEYMIVIAIIGILAAIAIPQFQKIMEKRGLLCLQNLVPGMTAPLPADKTCPRSGKPYKGTADALSCPEPEKHIDTNPRFLRGTDGAWRIEQTLPADAGKPFEFDTGRSTVVESPGRLSIHVTMGRFGRYWFGPFMLFMLVVIMIVCLVQIVQILRKKDEDPLAGPVIGIVVFAVLGYFGLKSMTSSHEWVFERGQVTRVEYEWGRRAREKVHARCLGVVPTFPLASSADKKLFLIHDGTQVTLLGTVASDRLDVATRLNRVLAP